MAEKARDRRVRVAKARSDRSEGMSKGVAARRLDPGRCEDLAGLTPGALIRPLPAPGRKDEGRARHPVSSDEEVHGALADSAHAPPGLGIGQAQATVLPIHLRPPQVRDLAKPAARQAEEL